MTKYVISGYIGADNFGDEAIAKVLTTHLKSLVRKKLQFFLQIQLKQQVFMKFILKTF